MYELLRSQKYYVKEFLLAKTLGESMDEAFVGHGYYSYGAELSSDPGVSDARSYV